MLRSPALHRYGQPRIFGLLWLHHDGRARKRFKVHIGRAGQRRSLCGLRFKQFADPHAFSDIACRSCEKAVSKEIT